jgi:hypothetical protein
MPSWPPSEQWAIAAMPCINLVYSHLYYDLFGDLERRLNRQLRGPPASETAERAVVPVGPANNDNNGQAANVQANNAPANAEANVNGEAMEEEPGLWATLWQLGNALLGLFEADEEVVIQAEVRVGGHDHNPDEHDEQVEMELEQLELEIEAEEREAIAEAAADAQPGAEAADNDGVMIVDVVQGEGNDPIPFNPEPAAVPGGDAAEGPDVPGPNGRRRQRQNRRDDDGPSMSLSDIVNNATTSLLLPTISFGMGELLRVTLPKAWVSRPGGAPAGLLQQRWGRSLVGGGLFIVLKDIFVLYAKYRKVEVKKHRRVRNVKRKRQVEDAAPAPAAASAAA